MNRLYRELPSRFGGEIAVAFSPDGSRLASAGFRATPPGRGTVPGQVTIWDLETGQALLALKGHGWDANCVAYSPDGRLLASGGADSKVRVWDAATGVERFASPVQESHVSSVAFSPDSGIVASAGNNAVCLWNARDWSLLRSLKGHTGMATGVAFSPDGKRLASCGADRLVKVWDTKTGSELLSLAGHTATIRGVTFRSDGKRLASAGGADRTVKVWDTEKGQLIQSFAAPEDVNGVAYSPDGYHLAAGTGRFLQDGDVIMWDTRTGQTSLSLRGFFRGKAVSCVAFSSDGQRLATGGQLEAVKVWEVGTQLDPQEINATSFSLAIHPDGQSLAVATLNKVQVFDVRTKKRVVSDLIGAHFVSFNPEGTLLVTRAITETIVWNTRTWKPVYSLGACQSVAFSSDGLRIAAVNSDSVVRVWDAATGKELPSLVGHGGQFTEVVFSPDGKQLALGGADRTIRVWDANGRRTVRYSERERHRRAYGLQSRRQTSCHER